MGERLQTALNWLRGFLEGMMGAQAYDETAFRRQVRDLLANGTPPTAPSESAGEDGPSDPPPEDG
ncbi:MAG TPA: hypothetical protein G4O00_15035 [Thermoflexia bacterium]|jgi:hypothetical protein|nr:hypothetical protein [Thermoflexia bacterium]